MRCMRRVRLRPAALLLFNRFAMIRNIRPSDREVYLRMVADFYRSPGVLHPIPAAHAERTFDELMRSTAYAEAFIFEHEGRIAGYGLLAKTFSQEAGGAVVWIEELYVAPEYRGAGLGRDFLRFVRREVHAARYRLEAERGNVRAVALYEREGFRPLAYDNYCLDA